MDDGGFGFTGIGPRVGVGDIILVAVRTGVDILVGVGEDEGAGAVTVGVNVSKTVGTAIAK